jgi:hypothetical protein
VASVSAEVVARNPAIWKSTLLFMQFNGSTMQWERWEED